MKIKSTDKHSENAFYAMTKRDAAATNDGLIKDECYLNESSGESNKPVSNLRRI